MEHGRHNSRSLLCRLMPCPRHLAYRPIPGTALALAVMVSLLTLGSCTPAKVIITKRYASVWVSRASSLSAPPRLPLPLFIISRYTSQHQKPPPQHPLRKAALPSIRARYSQRPATPTVLEANLTLGASPNQTAEVNPSSPSASPLKRARPRRTVTGGLKNLPVTPPANELLNRAVRLSKWLKVDEEKIKNQRQRARKLGALKLDTLTKSISKPLRDVLKAYDYELAVLHPFEATLADLTVRARAKQGHQSLPEVLKAVNELRKSVLETGKRHAAAAKNATSKQEAIEATEAGFREVESLMLEGADVVLDLIDVQKALRKIPIVQLGMPTVVLVGAPNVGKSSIVRAISTGTPEVNNYPFTTRGMTLGHLQYEDWVEGQCQVMDTPGVLNRPDEERNEMESLTLASMLHLPTAVMFVLDLTGNSGALSSIENQIQIRNGLRARFPKRPWVDVISKADLPMDQEDPAVARAPAGALKVSVADGTGLAELEARVKEMLLDVREVLSAIGLAEGPGGRVEGEGSGG